MPEEIQLLDLDGVHRITTLSPSSILRLRKLKEFPAPVVVGSKNMFVKSEVVEWVEARAAARARPGEIRRIVRVSTDGSIRHSSR